MHTVPHCSLSHMIGDIANARGSMTRSVVSWRWRPKGSGVLLRRSSAYNRFGSFEHLTLRTEDLVVRMTRDCGANGMATGVEHADSRPLLRGEIGGARRLFILWLLAIVRGSFNDWVVVSVILRTWFEFHRMMAGLSTPIAHFLRN